MEKVGLRSDEDQVRGKHAKIASVTRPELLGGTGALEQLAALAALARHLIVASRSASSCARVPSRGKDSGKVIRELRRATSSSDC